MLLALVGQYRLKILQVNVKSAFLNGDLQEEFYVAQPERFFQKRQEGEVMKLHKSIYCLRQEGRAWNYVLWKLLTTSGLVKSYNEKSLYTRLDSNGSRTIIVAYVDDILIVVEQEEELRLITTQIEKHVELTVDQSVTKFLGMCVAYSGGATGLEISNSTLIDFTFRRFSLLDANTVSTPIACGVRI